LYVEFCGCFSTGPSVGRLGDAPATDIEKDRPRR